jgi:hypothetical protein
MTHRQVAASLVLAGAAIGATVSMAMPVAFADTPPDGLTREAHNSGTTYTGSTAGYAHAVEFTAAPTGAAVVRCARRAERSTGQAADRSTRRAASTSAGAAAF